MNFCKDCDNLLEIVIETPEDQAQKSFLTFKCNCCNLVFSKEDSKSLLTDNCIYKLNFNTENIKIDSMINEYVHEDITLPRVKNIKCPNANCPADQAEILYIKYDNEAMKYLYVCCDCQKNNIQPSSWYLD